jgi:hypothetical protein
MERLAQIWKSSMLACGIAVVVGANAAPLLAQSTTTPLGSESNPDQDINNLFSNRDQGATSLFGLINRIQLLNGRSSGDFAAEQDENFQSAVSDFRKKQQQTPSPATPATPPTSTPAPLP